MPKAADSTQLIRAFGATRMAVGAISWLTPSLAARVFGVDQSDQPIVTELFGARDFALGFLTATTSGPTLEQVLRVGVALDAADTIASAREISAGRMSNRAKLMIAAGAATFTAIGVASLSGMSGDKRVGSQTNQ